MSTEPTHDPLEGEVRAMLHRRAQDIADRSVTLLPTVGARRAALGRVLAVAAAALVLVVGATALAVLPGGGDDGAERVVATSPEEDTSTTERTSSTTDETVDDEPPATTTTSDPIVDRDPTSPSTTAGPEPGRDPATPPTSVVGEQAVVTARGLDVDRWLQRGCDGSLTPSETALLVRLDRTGPTAEALTVQLGVTGRLAEPAPSTFTFEPGAAFGFVDLALPGRGAVELVVEVLPGPGYGLGSPARWTMSDPDPPILVDCLRPLVVAAGAPTQTIRVGDRPTEIRFAHDMAHLLRIVPAGDLPPGLTQVPAAGLVLTWGGAATTPGTYSFDVRACQGDLCDGTARVSITVLPA